VEVANVSSRPRIAVVFGLAMLTVGAPLACDSGNGHSAKKGATKAPPSGPHDYAQAAFDILPSGQYGSVPPPAQAADQAKLYDALTPLSGNVTARDLTRFFKSERLGTDGQGPLRVEPTVRPGLRIVHDKFHVPHVYGTTDDDVMFGAGYVEAEDRGLLLEQARYNARVAAIDAPGVDALSLTAGLKSFEPSAQTEKALSQQTQVLLAAGASGRAVLHDIDQWTAGINAYYRRSHNAAKPWARNDVYALNALKGQFVGQGGGGEAQGSMFLSALESKLGAKKGLEVFNDLREPNDAETPVSVSGTTAFQAPPQSMAGNLLLDNGSFEPTTYAGVATPSTLAPAQASNALLVTGARSANGHPLMVAGPQIGYYYPGLTMEIDLHGPGIDARGVSAATIGYILIGRSEDYAWSLTSAGLDIIDTYVETLCGGSDTKYEYKGRCVDMQPFDAGVLKGTPDQRISFDKTVHGPVVGYATVHGRKVAITRKRASEGRDALDLLLYRDLTLGNVHNVNDFFRAADQSPQTFNSFYLDDRDIGVFTSGQIPIRPSNVDPGLPIDGRGNEEWQGFVPANLHPQGTNPPNGQIVNWNNKTIAGYQAPDDNWSLGAEQRVQLLTNNLGTANGQTLESLTAAMNKAATQDVREMLFEPLLAEVLRTGPAPTPRAAQMLALLDKWRGSGGNRLDRNLDGKIDDPAAAIMDAAWTKLADAWAAPVLGPLTTQFASLVSPFDSPPGGQYGGWHVYMDKDLRALLGRPVTDKYNIAYCGNGNLATCRNALWGALDAAGDQLAATQGPVPTTWRADANAERITFTPGLLSDTMRYTNRPSGFQQLISFNGHRPR
jgi:acyl-homoserine lactone acylase PvdQ